MPSSVKLVKFEDLPAGGIPENCGEAVTADGRHYTIIKTTVSIGRLERAFKGLCSLIATLFTLILLPVSHGHNLKLLYHAAKTYRSEAIEGKKVVCFNVEMSPTCPVSPSVVVRLPAGNDTPAASRVVLPLQLQLPNDLGAQPISEPRLLDDQGEKIPSPTKVDHQKSKTSEEHPRPWPLPDTSSDSTPPQPIDSTRPPPAEPVPEIDYLAIISTHPERFPSFPLEIRNKREIALAAVKKNGLLLEHMNADQRKDEEIARCACEQNLEAYKFVDPTIRQLLIPESPSPTAQHVHFDFNTSIPRDRQYDADTLLNILDRAPEQFLHFPPEMRNQRRIALAAVKKDGLLLQHLNAAYKKDDEIVRSAIQQNRQALAFGDPELIANPDFVSTLFIGLQREKVLDLFRNLSDPLKSNKKVILAALKPNYLVFKLLDDTSRHDEEIVCCLAENVDNEDLEELKPDPTDNLAEADVRPIRKIPGELFIYTNELFNNPAFILKYVEQIPAILGKASATIKSDRPFMLRAIGIGKIPSLLALREFWNDEEMILAGLQSYNVESDINLLIQKLPPAMRTKNVLLAAFKHGCSFYGLISDTFKNSEQFNMEAVAVNPAISEFLNDAMKTNRKVALAAVAVDGMALQHFPTFNNDAKVVTRAVRQNGLALQFASDGLKEDENVVEKAVKQNGLALQFAAEGLKGNLKIAMLAMANNPGALEFVSENLKNSGTLTASTLT